MLFRVYLLNIGDFRILERVGGAWSCLASPGRTRPRHILYAKHVRSMAAMGESEHSTRQQVLTEVRQ